MAALTPAGKYLARGDCQPWLWSFTQARPRAPYTPARSMSSSRAFRGSLARPGPLMALTIAALVHHLPEPGEFGFPHQVGDVLELQPEAGVRAVQPEAVHTLLVGQPGKGSGQLHAFQFFKQGHHQPLHHPVDIRFGDEGHLHVDLGELGLAVGPQVLVPETPA